MKQATGSADRPRRFSALLAARLEQVPDRDWVFPSVTEWELIDEIPEAEHPQEFGLHEEYCFALLSSENLALHDLIHGSFTWGLDLYECSRTSDEVVVQGQPVKRRSPHSAYCHCGKCNWIWFLQGWECWPEQ